MKNPTLWASSQVLLFGLGFPIAYVMCACSGRVEFCLTLLLSTKWRLQALVTFPGLDPEDLKRQKCLQGVIWRLGLLRRWHAAWLSNRGGQSQLIWRGARFIWFQRKGLGLLAWRKIRNLSFRGPSCSILLPSFVQGSKNGHSCWLH